MRRRRKGNPLLGRMMLISVGVVLLLLPVLGYLGAFKVVKQQYMEVTMVKLPPPPPVPKSAAAKKAHPKPQVHRGGQTHIAGSSKPLPVHVAAAASPAAGAQQDSNSIVNGSNTNIGQIPVQPAAPPPSPTPPAPVSLAPVPAPQPVPAIPAPQPPPPTLVLPDQTAQVISDTQVKPQIPDDLRDSQLDAQFRALFTVHTDGTADVKVVDSTGNNELDQVALQAARRWRFRPAVHNGQPVQSYLRLEVEFQVS